jgi:hypothetical protein
MRCEIKARRKQKPQWLKIKATFRHQKQINTEALKYANWIDKRFSPEHLYFARYSADCSIEVSILTTQSLAYVQRESSWFIGVTKVKVTRRGTGSVAHAHAFRACNAIGSDIIVSKLALRDVIHWMHNMLSFSYADEIRNYGEMVASLSAALGAK